MQRTFIFCAMLLSACGGEDLEKGAPSGVSIANATAVECPDGGVVINQGVDVDQNGNIDADEISSSKVVCNGADGQAGAGIDKIYNVTSSQTNFCTRWVNEYCTLLSGRLTKFTNGLRLFAGNWFYAIEYADSTLSDPDTDTDSLIFSVDGYVRAIGGSIAIQKVARTGSDLGRWVWLVYTYSSDAMEVWYDTNGNEVLETTDARLEILTKTEVPLGH